MFGERAAGDVSAPPAAWPISVPPTAAQEKGQISNLRFRFHPGSDLKTR